MDIKRKEVGALLIAAIVLGIVFGFDDGLETFQLGHWTANFIFYACFAFMLLALFYITTKKKAEKHGSEINIGIWGIKRVGLRKSFELKRDLPLGIILPLLIAFVSYGVIPFAATLETKIKGIKLRRINKKFKRVSDIELATIQLAGPLMLMWAAILINIIAPKNPLVFMALTISLCQLLPLAGLNGLWLYYGSPLMYTFYMSLNIILIPTLMFLGTGLSIIISILAALILFLVYYQRKMVLGM